MPAGNYSLFLLGVLCCLCLVIGTGKEVIRTKFFWCLTFTDSLRVTDAKAEIKTTRLFNGELDLAHISIEFDEVLISSRGQLSWFNCW